MQFSLAKLRTFARRFARDEEGVVTVEWVAIAGIFVVTAVAVFLTIGGHVNDVLNLVEGQMNLIVTNASS